MMVAEGVYEMTQNAACLCSFECLPMQGVGRCVEALDEKSPLAVPQGKRWWG